MGLFRRATRTAGRVAKNVAKEAVFGDLENNKNAKGGKQKGAVSKARERREYEEYQRLKEKFEPKDDAAMQAEWQKYYEEQCEGECETCPYYDWCPDDFEEEEEESVAVSEEFSDSVEDASAEPEVELTEEQKAAKEAAEEYYEAGCDGECETCVHYDWCPAEEESDPDEKVVMMGMTQGEMKDMAKGSVQLAREGALAAKELKEAMDDIMGGLDINRYLK